MCDKKYNKDIILAVDMYGCPNRCRHCWLGHIKNERIENNVDEKLVEYFSPYFNSITFYSWLREPDFCEDYAKRWRRDKEISINAKPQRFELASFWRLVRDDGYVKFLKQEEVKTVQLTFFGLENTTDCFVGRKGAYRELLAATEILLNNGIAVRWQAFLYETNRDEIIELLHLSERLSLRSRCERIGENFKFFVHAGSCDGENARLYDIRIRKEHIPPVLIPYFSGYDTLFSEKELCEKFKNEKNILFRIMMIQ